MKKNYNSNVNLNKNANYISFTSPVLKNKKGHSKQITKSIRNIKSEDGTIDWETVEKYMEEIKQLISNFDKYYSDYTKYLEAKKNFSEFAMNAVFDGTEFSSKYNQEATKRMMENTIEILDKDGEFSSPAVLLAGVSAGGKTTTKKQMIGSIDTIFPATTQGNTTVGLLYAKINNSAKILKGAARFTIRASLEERISNALVNTIKKYLSFEQFDFYNLLFEELTIHHDRKCKLQYIISKKHLEDLNYSVFKDASVEIWDAFKKEIKNSLDINIKKSHLSSDNRIITEFEDYIINKINKDKAESIKINQLFNAIVEIIIKRVQQVISDLIKSLFNNSPQNVESSVTIVDENTVHKFDNQKNILDSELELIKYPKFISIEIAYSNNTQPDRALRKHFFKHMEFISSASEDKTLFPIVEEIRIFGNFKPLWLDEKESIENYILIDSEGLGHDMSQEGISIELRELISKCRKIAFVQNGSVPIDTNFANALSLLISTGAIYKTKFCFNRMESFDFKSSVDSRKNFIKSGIKNAIKTIVQKEENHPNKIVTGKEHIYEQLIDKQSLYFEYLGEKIESNNGIVPPNKLDIYNDLQEQYKQTKDETIYNIMANLREKFEPDFNPVSNINKLIGSFSETADITTKEIRSIDFKPHYSLYKFTLLFTEMNQEFVAMFLNKVNDQVWQTVKAFNARIARNYDLREWSNLRPESDYIGYAQEKIIAFLLNPENINDKEAIKDKGLFVQAISNLMLNTLSIEFRKIAKKAIYEDLLEDCWIPGLLKEGPGSTFVRCKIINDQIEAAFHPKKLNELFTKFKSIVFDNEVMRNMNIKLL